MTLTINRDYYLGASKQAPSRSNGIVYIIVHNTGNMNSTAKENASYMKRATFPNTGVNVTAFIDDGSTVYEMQDQGVRTWGAGSINRYTCLQVEQCYFSDQTKTLKAADNVAQYVADYIKTSGIKDYNIVSHKWASQNFGGSDHSDEIVGMSMDAFVALVNDKMDVVNPPQNKGEIDMILIKCVDNGRYYVTNGVTVRYIKTTRMLKSYQQAGVPTQEMLQVELDKEFGTKATAV
jgi:hypothetical protein